MNNTFKNCPQCGSAFLLGDKFCRACGNWFDKARAANNSFQSIVLMAVVAATVLGFIVYSMVTARPESEFVHPDMAGMDQTAMLEMENFMALLPSDYAGLVAQGNMSMDHGHYAEAIVCYDRALAINDTSADVRTDLGACYHALRQTDSALVQFTAALRLDPDHAVAHFNLGVVYHTIGDMNKTRQYWNRYLELMPESTLADTLKSILNSL